MGDIRNLFVLLLSFESDVPYHKSCRSQGKLLFGNSIFDNRATLLPVGELEFGIGRGIGRKSSGGVYEIRRAL